MQTFSHRLALAAVLALGFAAPASLSGADIVFRDTGQRLAGEASHDVVLGDVDGDGDLDAVTAQFKPLVTSPGINKLWLNNGSGNFTLSAQDLGSYANGVAIADLDGDTDVDIVFQNLGTPARPCVWLNQGFSQGGTPGTFVATSQIVADSDWTDVAVGQLDGLGGVDLLAVGYGTEYVLWKGDGSGLFTKVTGPVDNFPSFGVALADLDGDADLDVFTLYSGPASTGHLARRVWFNAGGVLTDSAQALVNPTASAGAVALGDLDGDADADAFITGVANLGEVWLNQGGRQSGTAGQFVVHNAKLSDNGNGTRAALGDLDGDGDLDALVGRSGTSYVWVNDGLADFTASTTAGLFTGNSGLQAVALGDLDGDGDLDAFIAQNQSQDQVWLNDTVTGSNRLINLSTRGFSGPGDSVMIPGFVLSGTGTKDVLIRAVGPTLASPPFNVSGVMADPQLILKGATIADQFNNDWGSAGDTALIQDAATLTGAFPLPVGSKDAALRLNLPAGLYTAQVVGASGGTGVALAEVYVVNDSATPDIRLVNLSTRGFVGTGDAVMIPGFFTSGNASRRLLVRGVGPTLGQPPFNVSGVLADPVLNIYPAGNTTPVATNDDWDAPATSAEIIAVSAQVGAFALPRGSADAALLITIPPNTGYTVLVSGKNGATGVALAEIYEVP